MKTLEKELNKTPIKLTDDTAVEHFLKEVDRNHDTDILKRVGMTELAVKIEEAKKISGSKLIRGDCYHISQITRVAAKYDLRFDHVSNYIGNIPQDFYKVLGNFLENNEVGTVRVGGFGARKETLPAFFILAPEEAFKPQPKNSDPLLFVQVDEQNYKLVHQWGSDMTFIRRLAMAIHNIEAHQIASSIGISCILFVVSGVILQSALAIIPGISCFVTMLGIRIWLNFSKPKTTRKVSTYTYYKPGHKEEPNVSLNTSPFMQAIAHSIDEQQRAMMLGGLLSNSRNVQI